MSLRLETYDCLGSKGLTSTICYPDLALKELYPLTITFIAYSVYPFSQLKMLRGAKGNIVALLLGLLILFYAAYLNPYFFKHPFLDGAYDNMLALNSKFGNNSKIPLVQRRDMYAPPDFELRLSVRLVYSFDYDVIWLPLRNDLARIADIIGQSFDVYQRPIYLVYVGALPLPSRLLPGGSKLLFSQLNTDTEQESVYHIPKKQWNL